MVVVLDEIKTLEKIKNEGLSFSRYGDGEFKLLTNNKCVSQVADPILANRLKQILIADQGKCLVCIPPVMGKLGLRLDKDTKKGDFWCKWASNKRNYQWVRNDITYGSSFISRPDNFDNPDLIKIYNLIVSLWDKEEVVLVTGVDKSIPVPDDAIVCTNATIIGDIRGRRQHAFQDYQEIYSQCIKYPKGTKFLICMGATASVLAFDLSLLGYTAYDIGHLPRFWSRFQ